LLGKEQQNEEVVKEKEKEKEEGNPNREEGS